MVPSQREAPAELIQPFGSAELARLLVDQAGPCVSIYLPTHRRHPEWKQDPVRYRALLAQIATHLGGSSEPRVAGELLDPLRRFEEGPHWEYSLDGLALFRSPRLAVAYRLPYSMPELALVADTFHTKPLLRFLHSNRRYLVLAVSQNDVALYEGGPFGVGGVDLRNVPQSLREALQIEERDRAFSQRPGGPGGVVFHGRGPGREQKKEDLLRYFRAIDRGLRDYLRDERVPLLLAAVGYYHPIYREANTYAGLHAEGLEGNFERSGPEEIHAASWPLISRQFTQLIETWAARYRELAGTGRAADRIEEVAATALAGRVRMLLLAEGESVHGVWDRANGSLRLENAASGARNDDVLDDIAEEVLRRGGEVLLIPRASMPTPSPIAAVYRY